MQTETKTPQGTYSLRVAACRYAAAVQGGDEKRAAEALADLERAPARTSAERINPFEAAARERKARLLVLALDRAFRSAEIDPASAAAHLAVETLSDDGWRSAAANGGVNYPSRATRELVVDTYLARAGA